MASWRASLSAGLTRYLLAGAALCSALYVVGLLGFAGAAHGALSGDPGPFLDTEVRSVTVEEASRMGRSGRGDAGPYLADFFAEVAEAGLRPDVGGPHTYRAGDSLVFYRVVQTGASGVEIRFLDCHEALRLLRAVKLAAVTVLLASFAAFAALGRRLVGAVEGRQALSDEIARRLLHDVKTPLAALLASGEGAAPGAATCPEGALDELAEAFDRLLLLGGPSGGDPCATDAREVVLDAARLVDRDAEGSGGRLAVDAPEPPPGRVRRVARRGRALLCGQGGAGGGGRMRAAFRPFGHGRDAGGLVGGRSRGPGKRDAGTPARAPSCGGGVRGGGRDGRPPSPGVARLPSLARLTCARSCP